MQFSFKSAEYSFNCSYSYLLLVPPCGMITYDGFKSMLMSVYLCMSIACCIPVAVCSFKSSNLAIAAACSLWVNETSLITFLTRNSKLVIKEVHFLFYWWQLNDNLQLYVPTWNVEAWKLIDSTLHRNARVFINKNNGLFTNFFIENYLILVTNTYCFKCTDSGGLKNSAKLFIVFCKSKQKINHCSQQML